MPANYNLHYLIVLKGEAAQQFVQGLQKYSGDEKDDEEDEATDAATSEFFERTSGGDHITDHVQEARDDKETQEKYRDVTHQFNKTVMSTMSFFTEQAKQFDDLLYLPNADPIAIMAMKLNFFSDQVKTGAPFDIKQPGKGYSPAELGGNYAIYYGNYLGLMILEIITMELLLKLLASPLKQLGWLQDLIKSEKVILI